MMKYYFFACEHIHKFDCAHHLNLLEFSSLLKACNKNNGIVIALVHRHLPLISKPIEL